MSRAARQKAGATELEAGYSVTLLGKVARAASKAVRASARAWAACLEKVFEVSPVLCVKCGGVMVLTALIQDDHELGRILAHQGWPTDFPKTRRYQDFLRRVCAGPEGSRPSPARAPPAPAADQDDTDQEDPSSEQWDARQDQPAGDWPA